MTACLADALKDGEDCAEVADVEDWELELHHSEVTGAYLGTGSGGEEGFV